MLISPFTSVRERSGELILSSLFHRQDVGLRTATQEKLVSAGILIAEGQWTSVLESYYLRLEAQFRRSKPTIGYIETTSRCPFTCIMCPKSVNKLSRKQAVMDLPLFHRIMDQLKHQNVITLHLFGDPLMDPLLFERLELCAKKGLSAIFSTNIPLFKRKDIARLFAVPVEQMIVSVDSLDPRTYTAIRRSAGNRAQSHTASLAPFLSFLEEFRSRKHRIKKLILRAVQLKMNRDDLGAIHDLAGNDPRIQVDIKPFIDFPLTGRPELGMDTHVDLNEPVLLYQTLGIPLPFKCTKPWKLGELAITSDGDVVPCCLCFNGPYSLGSLQTHTLRELYFSESYDEFRRKIFFSQTDPEWLCSSCESSSVKLTLPESQRSQIQRFVATAGRLP